MSESSAPVTISTEDSLKSKSALHYLTLGAPIIAVWAVVLLPMLIKPHIEEFNAHAIVFSALGYIPCLFYVYLLFKHSRKNDNKGGLFSRTLRVSLLTVVIIAGMILFLELSMQSKINCARVFCHSVLPSQKTEPTLDVVDELGTPVAGFRPRTEQYYLMW